jgi:hypothetical protein
VYLFTYNFPFVKYKNPQRFFARISAEAKKFIDKAWGHRLDRGACEKKYELWRQPGQKGDRVGAQFYVSPAICLGPEIANNYTTLRRLSDG